MDSILMARIGIDNLCYFGHIKIPSDKWVQHIPFHISRIF